MVTLAKFGNGNGHCNGNGYGTMLCTVVIVQVNIYNVKFLFHAIQIQVKKCYFIIKGIHKDNFPTINREHNTLITCVNKPINKQNIYVTGLYNDNNFSTV